MRHHQNHLDELCYPYIYEQGSLCDYEIQTDELCGHLGAAISAIPDDMPDILRDLKSLQPLAFHLNGSIRGVMAVDESDLAWLNGRLSHYRDEIDGLIQGFVLPRGVSPVPQLHQARSASKKTIRLMVRLKHEGFAVPVELPRLCNLMCNFLFTLTLVINYRRGLIEIPFISKSYGVRHTHHTNSITSPSNYDANDGC